MENQQGPAGQHRELCSMEGSLGEMGYMCMYGWVPLLSTRNYHNIVNQLYPKIKKFFNVVEVLVFYTYNYIIPCYEKIWITFDLAVRIIELLYLRTFLFHTSNIATWLFSQMQRCLCYCLQAKLPLLLEQEWRVGIRMLKSGSRSYGFVSWPPDSTTVFHWEFIRTFHTYVSWYLT